MSRDGLHDFQELRTRPPEPPEQPEKRRCAKCDAVLRSGNTGTLCGPCGPGEIDVPGWILAMAEHADGSQINVLARLITGEPGRSRWNTPDPDPPDPEAPECACGCEGRTLRPMRGGGNNRRLTTGPYQRFIRGHWTGNRMWRKGATQIETEESREPLESGSQPAMTS